MTNPNDQPRTIRALLLPIVGAAALSDAESRVYDLPAPNSTEAEYMCRDGFCALGIIARSLYQDRAPRFPCADDVVDYDRYGHAAWNAADGITKANDRGDLATPGALTALLDADVMSATTHPLVAHDRDASTASTSVYRTASDRDPAKSPTPDRTPENRTARILAVATYDPHRSTKWVEVYSVQSASHDWLYYDVRYEPRVNRWACQCPAGRHPECRHRVAAQRCRVASWWTRTLADYSAPMLRSMIADREAVVRVGLGDMDDDAALDAARALLAGEATVTV